jgi:hypothetical protein
VREAGVRERALQRLGRIPGPCECEDLAGGVPAASASAICPVTQFASANSLANARTRTRPPGPLIAISALGARRWLWLTQRTAASRISARERKLRPSTISVRAG